MSKISSSLRSHILFWARERFSEAASLNVSKKELLKELDSVTIATSKAGLEFEDIEAELVNNKINLTNSEINNLRIISNKLLNTGSNSNLDDVLRDYRGNGGLKDPNLDPRFSGFYKSENLVALIGENVTQNAMKVGEIYYTYSDSELIWAPCYETDYLYKIIRSELSKIYSEVKKIISLPSSAARGRSSLLSSKKAESLIGEISELIEVKSFPEADPKAIAVQNKVIDLSTGEARELSKEDYFTQKVKKTAYNKDSLGKSESFASLLAMFDESEIEYLQRFYGTSLIGSSVPRTLFLSPGGGLGKTIFNSFVREVLEDYAVLATTNTFKAGNAARRDRARLENARFVFVDEFGNFNLDSFRALVGGRTISAKRPFRETKEMRSIGTYVFVADKLPKGALSDKEIKERAVRVTVKPRTDFKEDHFFFEQLTKDPVAREDLLAWLIEGAVKYLSNPTFISENMPESIREATNEWFPDNDS